MSYIRGQQKLFKEVFVEAPALTAKRQGRSETLHNLRNECLVDRFYFYGKFTDKRYSAILDLLKFEFFLETFTIQERINENYGLLSELKLKQPGKNYFHKKWPHLVW
jgi:hypothetical protein